MKAETSALRSDGALPCDPAGYDRLRLPLALPGTFSLRFGFDSRSAGRGACEVVRRRTCDDRVPGTQFSLSESPASRSRSGLLGLNVIDLDSLDGWLGAFVRSVSNLPREETVRESLRLFSPWEVAVREVSVRTGCRLCLADMLRDKER